MDCNIDLESYYDDLINKRYNGLTNESISILEVLNLLSEKDKKAVLLLVSSKVHVILGVFITSFELQFFDICNIIKELIENMDNKLV